MDSIESKIAEARRLWAATTRDYQWAACCSDDGKYHVDMGFQRGGEWDSSDMRESDANWIEWSHNNTPAMLSEIERLRQRCSDLWGVLHDAAATIDSAGSNELYARVQAELDKGALGLTGTAGKDSAEAKLRWRPGPPTQVALCMIEVKIARLCHSPGHEDSVVDIAGYANCIDLIRRRPQGSE